MQVDELKSPLLEAQIEEDKKWFVMRDLKRPNANLPAYKELSQKNFQVFTPMKWHLKSVHGRRVREEVPFVQDLLFVFDTKERIEKEVDMIPTLQFRFGRGLGYRQPMTVRNEDMDRFINAVRSNDEPLYFLPSELTPDMCGRTVRIVGGVLDGFTGKLLKIKGARQKRILVELPGQLTVACKVDTEYIQFTD